MPIEFDPSTSSYYQVTYSGQSVERPAPQEPPPPPPEQQAAPPPEPVTDLPPAYEDPALQKRDTGYPGGLTAGSIVDEVV
jgi:hypothetical protein